MRIIDEPTLKLLTEMGFIDGKDKDMGLYSTEIENGKAFIDFRQEDGRRYAKVGEAFVKTKDADTIPILKTFKEERKTIKDALLNIGASLQSPSKGNLTDTAMNSPLASDNKGGEKTVLEGDVSDHLSDPIKIPPGSRPAPPNPNQAQQGKPTPTVAPPASQSPKTKNVFLHEIVTAYDIDICELFGDAGSGKSQLAKQIALDAITEGKKVLYVDTERGFLKSDIKKLSGAYQYVSNLKEVLALVQKIPKEVDIFILDSVGYPVLTEWAKLAANERGNALTQIIAVKDYIKDWAINNGKVAIVINQPDSDFGKELGYENRPFGDKGQFVIKEVFHIKRTKASTTEKTISILTSFRSRYEGRGTAVAQIEITGEGVKII